MTSWKLVFRSLAYHKTMNLAVALGAVAATAVLTGALIVGDSMTESLRGMALGHLGRIDDALVADHFFREALAGTADTTARQEIAHGQHLPVTAPLIMLPGGVEKADAEPPVRANRVQIIGCDARFWSLGTDVLRKPPGRQEIVLTRTVADQLGVKPGDAVLVRLPRPGMIPAESALGRKRDTTRVIRMKLTEIVETRGLAGFTLAPSQQEPRNAFVALEELQDDLEQPAKANALVRAGTTKQTATADFQPTLADYGLRIEATGTGYTDISSERLLLSPELETKLTEKLLASGAKRVQPVLAYLANTIACGGKEVPYSTIAAIDFTSAPPLGPFSDKDKKPVPALKEGEIAINDWTAERLQAHLGDTVKLTYFEPISTTGVATEATKEFKLAAIVAMAGPANDPRLTPTVKGLSDRQSIADWDPPFPFNNHRIHRDDEQYWKDHHGTPKAFVSLATGRKLWGNRFGQATSLRVDTTGMAKPDDIAGIALDPNALGFQFQAIRSKILDASTGTTPFGVLFLLFSMFVIAAALILVALLFRLGVERRAAEVGILLAVGYTPRLVARMLVAEGLIVAVLGSAFGTLAGIGYAALMILGLRTWWLAAVSTPFLELHFSITSLLLGLFSGSIMAVIVIWLAVRKLARIAPQRLLVGDTSAVSVPTLTARRSWRNLWLGSSASQNAAQQVAGKRTSRNASIIDWALLISAILPGVILPLFKLDEETAIGAFFGAGSWSLAALVWLAYRRLKRGATGVAIAAGAGNALRMSLRNAARNPGRSAMSIALVASASFLIVAVSVFHIDPIGAILGRRGGSGGFALVCQSDQPVYVDLDSKQGREQLDLSNEDEAVLAKTKIYRFRVKSGDEASCMNLYKPTQPQVYGVPKDFCADDPTRFADAAGGEEGVFTKLSASTSSESPTIIDRATSDYSLHLDGVGSPYALVDSRGRKLEMRVAALLDNSIFQGALMVDETRLLQYDNNIAGYKFFLVDCPPDKIESTRQSLERVLEEHGFMAQPSRERLAGFLAIQNTYLSTFQSLGGLGLLLGTFGLAIVQLRNQLERRRELALLQAVGYGRGLLLEMVVIEYLFLLVAGLVIGIVAAAVAVWPQLQHHASSLPWAALGAILAVVAITGLVASLLAASQLARLPLITALHGRE